MATAKDRAAVNLSMSPNATVPLDPKYVLISSEFLFHAYKHQKLVSVC